MGYVIRNKRTKKWVYGTDYRYSPPHQRTSFEAAFVCEDIESAELMFTRRRCGQDYEIVPVRIEVENE